MKIRNAFSGVLPVGQMFTEPSITQPDLAYSIEQLVADYSVGSLPSLASLQPYLDDEDEKYFDGVEDVRFSDKAEALEKFLQANGLRRSIYEKVKKAHEFQKKKREKLLEEYQKKFGAIEEPENLSEQ